MKRPEWALAVLVAMAACGDDDDQPSVDASADATPPPSPCTEHAAMPAGRFRLFAVGHKFRVADLVTAADFEAAVRATVDAEVVPNLATDRPNLLVFPEDIGLLLSFTGPR